MVVANWSGKWPGLCHGEWSLEVNGVDVSDYIPYYLRTSEMNTYGTYEKWHFEDWEEVWEDYEDGMDCEAWIEDNKEWLNIISNDIDVQREIFDAINVKDWRHDSCGGCI